MGAQILIIAWLTPGGAHIYSGEAQSLVRAKASLEL